MRNRNYTTELKNIKQWIIDNNKYPSSITDNVIEQKYHRELCYIKGITIKSYNAYYTEEERKAFIKNNPSVLEEMKVLEEIEEIKFGLYVKALKDIKEVISKEGFELSDLTIDIKERLITIKTNITHTLSKNDKNTYMEIHPNFVVLLKELEDIETIIQQLRNKNKVNNDNKKSKGIKEKTDNKSKTKEPKKSKIVNKYLENLSYIKQWMEDNNINRPPHASKKADEQELLAARRYQRLKSSLIIPYLGYEKEEEKQLFESKHPELKEVLEFYYSVQENNNDKNEQNTDDDGR